MPAKKIPAKEVNAKEVKMNVLFNKLFEQGQRLGLNAKQTKEFLDRNYSPSQLIPLPLNSSNQTIRDIEKRIAFLESQKSLDQNSLDDLAKWRNAAAIRINNAKKARQVLIDAIENQYAKFHKEITPLQKKLDSDIAWYKNLGKVISRKINGFKFTGTVVD